MEDDDNYAEFLTLQDCTLKLTLDEYFREKQTLGIEQSRIDCLRVMLESRAIPGDQWWEWVRGTEPMMQYGGIALVRNGAIVWARETWIS